MIGSALRLTRAMRYRSHPVEKKKRIELIETRRGKGASHDHPFSLELRCGVDELFDGSRSHHSLQQTDIPALDAERRERARRRERSRRDHVDAERAQKGHLDCGTD